MSALTLFVTVRTYSDSVSASLITFLEVTAVNNEIGTNKHAIMECTCFCLQTQKKYDWMDLMW